MKFDNTRAMNFKGAFSGMRNPKNSWDKSDSFFGLVNLDYSENDYYIAHRWLQKRYPEIDLSDFDYSSRGLLEEFTNIDQWLVKNGMLYADDTDYPNVAEVAFIGPNDMNLAQRLIKAGSEHRKFLRQVVVTVDIAAPLFWWKEFDTYKIGTTANSTSTMHKLASTPITLDCFEIDDMTNVVIEDSGDPTTMVVTSQYVFMSYIDQLEKLRKKYNETKDKKYWKELIRLLPESWLQTRTVTMNYENILSICQQRKGHKLSEWTSFIDWAHSLPYANELLFLNKKE